MLHYMAKDFAGVIHAVALKIGRLSWIIPVGQFLVCLGFYNKIP